MSEIDLFDDEIDAALFDAALNAANTRQSSTQLSAAPQSEAPINLLNTNNRSSERTVRDDAGPSQPRYIQQTLFGATQVPEKQKKSIRLPSGSQTGRTIVYQPPPTLSQQKAPKVKAVKKWDRIKAIQALPKALENGRNFAKDRTHDHEDEDEEEILNEDNDVDSDTDLLMQAIRHADQTTAATPMKLTHDQEAIKTWVYSINKPKRKYQYDIVARALFNNCLVSLPTGLGKTFIAAVVMLNFYRWYPKGKILFLAPTRPLVQQQIEACHSIAGMPSVDCVSLTGTIPASQRAEAWIRKRVIFATPQTVANDLRRGALKPEDVICVVIDEAHRATGAYAYCVVVRLLMRFNPHFRVLALTATPGSDPEKVQGVIDNLHIGHIEVRTEESMDIKPYTKNKQIILEKIPLTPELTLIRDQWAALMLPLIKQCDSLFWGSKDPAYLHAFSVTSALMNVPRERSYLRPNLSILAKMATAMSKLLEYSITLAYEKMLELKQEKTRCAIGICSQTGYKTLMNQIQQLTTSPTYTAHPKMDKMKALTIEFFLDAQEQGKTQRLMIFCHFRDMVTDIVNFLNKERPLIVASAFIGQSSDVKGNRGMNQKTQNEVIQRFKNNEFNVLVATSIGEEGLDIGALDCIICYEAQKSPLRMLQRLGRTGRNEDGKVIVLIAEGREDKNWEKAQDQYQHVQNALLSNKVIELYDDCERLLPQGCRPVSVDRTIEVQPYVSEQVDLEMSAAARKRKEKKTKRKRPGLEDLPPNALLGFVSAKDYKIPQSKAESLRERAEAALLNANETEILEKNWCKSVTSGAIEPPLSTRNMSIQYFSSGSLLSKRIDKISQRNKAATRLPPSARFADVFKRCTAFAEDEAQYDAWKSAKGSAFDEKLVTWWAPESRGIGAKRPLRLCTDARNSIKRPWTRFQDHSESDAPKPDSSHPSLNSRTTQKESPSSPTTYGLNQPTSRSRKSRDHADSLKDSSPAPLPSLSSATTDDDLPDLDQLVGGSKFLGQPTDLPSKNLKDSNPSKKPQSAQKLSSDTDALTSIKFGTGSVQQPDNMQMSSISDQSIIEGSQSGWMDGGLALDNDPEFMAFDFDDVSNEEPFPFPTGAEFNGKQKTQEQSSDDYHFSELDPDDLAELDEIENRLARPMNPPGDRQTSQVTEQTALATPRNRTDLARRVQRPSYDPPSVGAGISPLIFRSTRTGARPQPSPSEYENEDHFAIPALVATQMPRLGRWRAGEMQDGKKQPSKRVIVEESDEEDRSMSREKVLEKSDSDESDSEELPLALDLKGKSKLVESSSSHGHSREIKPKRKGKQKSMKRGNDWALKTGMFDLEASESDDSEGSDEDGRRRKRKGGRQKRKKIRRSSSASIESENSIDRAFIADTSSSHLNGSSPDKSMGAFYRASIMSQHPMVAGKFDREPNRYNGRFKWKEPNEKITTNRRTIIDTPDKDDRSDGWSYDSFCVPDEQTIEYDETEHGGSTSEL